MSRHRTFLVLVCSFTLLLSPTFGQQTAAPTISANSVLRSSLAAQVGNTQISDVTLTGSAHRIAGSDDETGTVTLKVLPSGATRLDFNFPSGPRIEFKSFDSSGVPVGGWSGPDGVFHEIVNHNLMNDWGWFPLFSLASATAQNSVVSLVGIESRNGQSVVHLAVSQQFPSLSGEGASLMTHLSRIDIFLDETTHLPAAILYNIHPDNNSLLDIPVELQFSDYRPVNGAQIPFHIQKSLNNSLAFDLQFQNVALNSGLTAAQVGGAQ